MAYKGRFALLFLMVLKEQKGREQQQAPVRGVGGPSGNSSVFLRVKIFYFWRIREGFYTLHMFRVTALRAALVLVLTALGLNRRPKPLLLSAAHRWGAIALWGLPADTRDPSTR